LGLVLGPSRTSPIFGFVGNVHRGFIQPPNLTLACMLVLVVSAEMTGALTAALSQPAPLWAKPDTPAQAVWKYLNEHDITAAPMFPGAADESLSTYFALYTRDDEPDHRQIIEEMSALPGIEGIYWKPDEGMP
jgi:hypothetical protein